MRAKCEIERQIEHFRSHCTSDAAETEIWIKALQWVLGDEEHQRLYDRLIEELATNFANPDTTNERIMSIAGKSLIERLR